MKTLPIDRTSETVIGFLNLGRPRAVPTGPGDDYTAVADRVDRKRNRPGDDLPAGEVGVDLTADPARDDRNETPLSKETDGDQRIAPTQANSSRSDQPEQASDSAPAKPPMKTASPQETNEKQRSARPAVQTNLARAAVNNPVTKPAVTRPAAPISQPDTARPAAPVSQPTAQARALMAEKMADVRTRVPALELLSRRYGEAAARLFAKQWTETEDTNPFIPRSRVNPAQSESAREFPDQRTAANDFNGKIPVPATKVAGSPSSPTGSGLTSAFASVPSVAETVIAAPPETPSTPTTQHAQPALTLLPPVGSTTNPAAAVATAAPAQTDMAGRIERFQALAQRVVGRVAAAVQNGGGTAVIRLQPEFLGRLRIEVSVDRGEAGVQLVTDNPQIRRLLQTEHWWLRDALSAHGIELSRFDVQSGDPGAAFAGAGFADARDARSRRPELTANGRPAARSATIEETPAPVRRVHNGQISLTV